ncbi:MAG: hypothetical protein V3T07_01795, partial [Myxococcota bacterium]
ELIGVEPERIERFLDRFQLGLELGKCHLSRVPFGILPPWRFAAAANRRCAAVLPPWWWWWWWRFVAFRFRFRVVRRFAVLRDEPTEGADDRRGARPWRPA